MTWPLVGWILIGLATMLLLIFRFLFKDSVSYPVRRFQAVEQLKTSRVSALERGQKRGIFIGHHLWSRTYPGLGLGAVSALPAFIDMENKADGGQRVTTSDGGLLVLARQIAFGRYKGGFSQPLSEAISELSLPGTSPLSYTAGMLSELRSQPYGSLALLGNYGPEALLWAETLTDQNKGIFAAAGSLSSQAALFLNVRDLLIGEEVFALNGLIESRAEDEAAWLTEDILRVALILLIVVGAVLKMAGVL
jgi:hypothetical protein